MGSLLGNIKHVWRDVQQMQHQNALLRVGMLSLVGRLPVLFLLAAAHVELLGRETGIPSRNANKQRGYRGHVSGNPPSPNPS